jgi:hypothetical protein
MTANVNAQTTSGLSPRTVQSTQPRRSLHSRGRPGATRCATPITPTMNAAEYFDPIAAPAKAPASR